jgi:ATP-binding cassette, subfamily B, bacterial
VSRFLVFLRHAFVLSWRADRRTTVILTLLLVGNAGVVAAIGLSQRWLLDTAPRGDIPAVVGAVLLGAVAFALRSSGGSAGGPLRVYLMERVDVAFTDRILAALGAIPTLAPLEDPAYLDRIDRLRRGSWAMSTSLWSVAGTVSAGVSLLASVVLLASVDPFVCLMAALAVPPLVTGARASRSIRDAREAAAQVWRHEQELHELCLRPDAAKELLVSQSAPMVSERADALWREVTAREARGQLAGLAWQVLGWFSYAVGYLAGLWIVVTLVRRGEASLGTAAMVISLATNLQGQISTVVWNSRRVAEVGHVADHYRWLLKYAAARPGGTEPAPERLTTGIELRGVQFRYPNAATDALHGVDLTLVPGTTLAVVGENGAGKTTLVKLLIGLYTPTAGQLLVDGVPLPDLDQVAWRTRLSAVFQDFGRYRFRAVETVGVGQVDRVNDRGYVRDAIRRADADAVLDRLPDGLDTQLGSEFGGVEPSVGQWQKLALARAQMRRNPLLVMLDEPTAALDPQAEHELFEHFDRYARDAARAAGTITLLISHRFSTVRMADRIVVLDGGRVAESGSHDELMLRDGPYARAYRLQAAAYVTGNERV